MADIISKDPISDGYVDQVIKANEALDENSSNTQGVQLRKLVKDLRDRLETEVEKSNAAIAGKVDAVAGKGLSTLDFTQADKDTVDSFDNLLDDVPTKGYVKSAFANVDNVLATINTTINKVESNGVTVLEYYTDPYLNFADKRVSGEPPLPFNEDFLLSDIMMPGGGGRSYFDPTIPANYFSADSYGFLRIKGVIDYTVSRSASMGADINFRIENNSSTLLNQALNRIPIDGTSITNFQFEVFIKKSRVNEYQLYFTINGEFKKLLRLTGVDITQDLRVLFSANGYGEGQMYIKALSVELSTPAKESTVLPSVDPDNN